jgi:hypothetical protein
MSLLDDVSIVVTPNGYKAGELYAVVPVPTEGAEILSQPVDLVTDFVVNSGGVIVDADTFTTSGGNVDGIKNNLLLTVGTRYELTIEGNTTSSGFTIGNTSSSGNEYGSGFGTHIFTASVNTALWLRQKTAGTTNITSFSIKEYTSADMDVTRATDATRVDENGLIETVAANVPRIDYTGGGCPHILAEPQRTNLITYSEDLSQWTTITGGGTASSSVTANYGISPDGTQNASRVQLDKGNTGFAEVFQLFTTTSGVTNTQTMWLKSLNGTPKINFGWANTSRDTITLTTEWQRYTFTYTSGGVSNAAALTLYDVYDPTTAQSIDVLAWGSQAEEESSYPTSYIPTSGSTVTRNQDIFTRDGIGSLINSPEGSFFIEMAAINHPPNSQLSISLSGDSSSDRVLIYTSSAGGEWLAQFRKDSVNIVSVSKNTTITNQSKVAISWKSGKYLMYIDGDKATNYTVGSETTSTTFEVDDLKNLQFSPNHNTSSNLFYGKVKQLQVYDTALTDVQLASLTS